MFGPYTTGATYWRFYFEMYDNGVVSGNTHQVAIKFYLAHNGSGNYYSNAEWNFNYAVNGVAYTYKFSGSGNVANSSDYSAKTQIGSTQYVNVTSPNPLAAASISVKATMSERSGSTSPHSSSGGSGTISLSATATSVGSGSITSVTDNGNNTVTISGKSGANGTNNAVTGCTLYYRFASSGAYSSISVATSASTNFTKSLSIPSTASVIYYYITTSGSLNSASTSAASKTVKYYANPGAPGKPTLASNKSKISVRSTLTWSWTAAAKGNDNSPIVGYRLRLYKNDAIMKGINPSDANADCYDTESTGLSFVISDALKEQLKAGDKIKLGIYAYAKNGAGTQLFNGGGVNSSQVFSDEYTIQNEGIVRIKVGGVWKEGQTWIKVNGVWKEASTVYVKSNGVWKEST